MVNLQTRNGLDGFVHADPGWDGNFISVLNLPGYAAGAYQMSRYDCGNVLSNAGAAASSTTTIKLPPPQNGLCVVALKAVKASTLVVQATNGAAIIGGTSQGAANGTATDALTTTFSFCFLQSDGINWYMMANVGTWTIA
jgi:hypothetical protein